MTTATTELYDPLEGGSGGGGNFAPTVSWPNFKRKAVAGLILPDSSTGVEKPYRVVQQTKMGSNEPLFFDDEQKRPRTQNEFTLLTELRDFAGTSDQFQERVAERNAEAGPDEQRVDDGRRRVIVKGKPMLDQLRDAVKAGGGKPNARGNYIPEVGGTLSFTWLKKVNIPNSEKTQNVFDITYTPPTPETAQRAREFAASIAPATDGDGLDEPSGAAPSKTDDPPF